MTDIRLADISEFQQNLDAPAYLKGGHFCVIVRAHNGNRPDHMWPARRDYVRGFPFVAVGYYQYLVASRDASAQAHDFIGCVGSLRDNEFVVCDSEEGSGPQSSRVQAWFDIVDAKYGMPSTLYASESWFAERLGGATRWKGRPRWIAAYRSSEPTVPHEFWQYTDRASFPGLAGTVDGNLFHGTAQQFAAMARGGKTTAPPAAPAPPAGTTVLGTATNADGRLETFVITDKFEVLHCWQHAAGGWSKWESMGVPGK